MIADFSCINIDVKSLFPADTIVHNDNHSNTLITDKTRKLFQKTLDKKPNTDEDSENMWDNECSQWLSYVIK